MNKKSRSILRTFYVTFFALMMFVIVVGGIVSLVAAKRVNERLIANYNTQQLEVAKQTSTTLQSQVDTIKAKLLFIAQVEAIRSLDPKVCDPKIDEIIASFGQDIGNIGRIGPDGKFYCSGNKQLLGVKGSTLGSYIDDIFNDPEHKPVMSRMIYPKGATSYLLAVHVPVIDSKGKFMGTLGGAISVDNLAENYLKDIQIGKTGFVTVADDNGDIIYNRDNTIIGKNRYSQEIQALFDNNSVLNSAFEAAKSGQDAQARYKVRGEERIAVLTSVEVNPGRRWIVYGVIPVSEVDQVASDLGFTKIFRRLVGIYSFSFLIAALVLLWFMRRRVFRPIQRLTEASRKVQAGNLKTRVRMPRNDELGQLGMLFNAMLDQISSYNKDLETEVKQKTELLSDTLALAEHKNKTLEDTKKAMLNVLNDLAEEKDNLKTESTRVEALFDSIGDGLVVTDQYGKVVQVNPVAEKLLGTKATNLVGKWYPDVVELYDQDGVLVAPEERPIMKAITDGKAFRTRALTMAVKGKPTKFPVSITASPLLVNNQPLGVVVIFRDITQERELDEAKDDFVSLVSHQLRTPATAVKQFLGMIIEGYAGKVTAEQKDFINTAYESNERQIGIIDDLLNVSRLDLGKLKPNLQAVDITALVKDIYQIMVPKTAERKQKLELNATKSYTIQADPNILRMAIENFVDNASKYTPDGGSISLSVTNKGKNVYVAIADTGVGIAQKDVKRLFKKFSRIENSLSVIRGGSGLGLYIAHQIVLLHKGKLTVESKLGKGTTFTIQLKQEG